MHHFIHSFQIEERGPADAKTDNGRKWICINLRQTKVFINYQKAYSLADIPLPLVIRGTVFKPQWRHVCASI